MQRQDPLTFVFLVITIAIFLSLLALPLMAGDNILSRRSVSVCAEIAANHYLLCEALTLSKSFNFIELNQEN